MCQQVIFLEQLTVQVVSTTCFFIIQDQKNGFWEEPAKIKCRNYYTNSSFLPTKYLFIQIRDIDQTLAAVG
jgi:hypothetical protein